MKIRYIQDIKSNATYTKLCLSIYSWMGWCWLCVRGELETGTDCYILTPSSSDHSSTSFSSWQGLLNRGSLRAQSPLSAAGSHSGILSPTDSNSNWLKPSVSRLYFCLTPTCFLCSSAYLHRCISWLTARSRVNMLHLVESDSKSPFSIATTPRCRGGHYSILWIVPVYPRSSPYSAEC